MLPEETFEQQLKTDPSPWFKRQRYILWRAEMEHQRAERENRMFRYKLASKLIREGKWHGK